MCVWCVLLVYFSAPQALVSLAAAAGTWRGWRTGAPCSKRSAAPSEPEPFISLEMSVGRTGAAAGSSVARRSRTGAGGVPP